MNRISRFIRLPIPGALALKLIHNAHIVLSHKVHIHFKIMPASLFFTMSLK